MVHGNVVGETPFQFENTQTPVPIPVQQPTVPATVQQPTVQTQVQQPVQQPTVQQPTVQTQVQQPVDKQKYQIYLNKIPISIDGDRVGPILKIVLDKAKEIADSGVFNQVSGATHMVVMPTLFALLGLLSL